ncbi:MAG: hypothetical protein SGJ19_25815 [Planctomycetia bacterium]|mgnify:CR=1 FL=1|nr:hypothetical protein [Planctomycetia bacterium]
MLPELTSILPIIHALPTDAKQELLEILVKDLEPASPKSEVSVPMDEPFVYDPENPMLGLFYDEPEVVDEVLRLAMEARQARNARRFGE